MTTTPLADRPHALYRFYDRSGRLLYVGLTMDPSTRWRDHAKGKPWWLDVKDIRIEHFQARTDVEAAELAAIKAEKPLYNVTHNRGSRAVRQAAVRTPVAVNAGERIVENPAARQESKFPRVPTFARWIRDVAEGDGDLSHDARPLVPYLSGTTTFDTARLALTLAGKGPDALAWLDHARDVHAEESALAGVKSTTSVFDFAADRGELWTRRIVVQQDVAAHVQLDRDTYVDWKRSGGNLSHRFRVVAQACAREGLEHVWATGVWRHRPIWFLTNDRVVNLIVPLPLLNPAVSALVTAELDGDLDPLRELASTLMERPVR